ncbi:MAG TPA: family 78 glycoside hydrolase catalytic domain, partial [Terriglobia bacterium]|nr:family 78 glycoside hydrolase catalytic domain [Terriglobia bacterium]
VLYLNGQKVGFGPPISDPRRRYFDLRNIQPYLRKGQNTIAARVYSLATATEDTKKERGWFALQGGVHDGGREIVLDTGPEWKCLVSEVWKRDAPRQSFQLHYIEIADLRKEPVGWNDASFDDSHWQPALRLPEEMATLVRRELGEIDEVFIPAAGVVRTAEVERQARFQIPALQVNAEKFQAIQTVTFKNLPLIGAARPGASVETSAEGHDAALALDMGRMVLGCPFFEVEGDEGASVDVSISEYLKDGRVLASREITPNERTNLTDRITLRQGRSAWQRSDYNGYRYLQLTVRGARAPLTIRKVGTVERRYRFEKEATFHSSNATLDSIFDGCKWTHRVNTHWGYCGSAWREHAQWVDLPWHAMNLVVFHNPPAMRYYLRQIALGQNAEGRMQFPYPGSIAIELPEQSMWLADALWKCALYFNDLELVKDLLPVMVKANEWFKKHLTGRGLITTANWPKMWLVIDWGYPYVNNPAPGELASLNLIYYHFLHCVEQCAHFTGDESVRMSFQSQADSLRQAIQQVFYASDEARYYEKPQRQAPSQFASLLAVKYGVAPEARRQQVFQFATGSELRPEKASPWFMYSVLEAFAQAGRYTDAVSAICRYWSTFLDAGATVYWELWNIPGEDVHPIPGYTKEMGARTITYSSGPAPYVVNHILGVQPLAAGFREVLIAPRYSGLRFAEGEAPTPAGAIRVRWQRDLSEKVTEVYVTALSGLNATMRLPFEESEPVVLMNNQLLYDGRRFLENSRIEKPVKTKDALQFQIKPGFYYFRSSATREDGMF